MLVTLPGRTGASPALPSSGQPYCQPHSGMLQVYPIARAGSPFAQDFIGRTEFRMWGKGHRTDSLQPCAAAKAEEFLSFAVAGYMRHPASMRQVLAEIYI